MWRFFVITEIRSGTNLDPEIDLLLDQLKNSDPGDRRRAALALGKCNCRDVMVQLALLKVGLDDQDPFAQYEAMSALEALGFPNPKSANLPDAKQIAVVSGQSWNNNGFVEGVKFSVRAGAYLIDRVFIVVVGNAIIYMTSFIMVFMPDRTGRGYSINEQSTQCLNYLIGMIIMIPYFVIFEWLYGATPGKLILGMRVIQENGTPCNLGAALIRGLMRLIDGLFFGVVAFSVMHPPLYQRTGDKSAGTIVVNVKDTLTQQPREWWWFFIASGIYMVLDIIFNLLIILSNVR